MYAFSFELKEKVLENNKYSVKAQGKVKCKTTVKPGLKELKEAFV